MKKIIALLLVAVMCLPFVACDESGNTEIQPSGENTENNGGSTSDTTTSENNSTNDTDGNETPHTHSFGDWITAKEATEAEEGSKERTCACGEKETEAIDKLKVSEGLEFALNEDDSAYSVIGIGTCTDSELIIPGTYQGLPVTSIANNAFQGNTTIVSVTTGSGVVSIGVSAFERCTSLKKMVFSDSFVRIQEYAFRNCFALADIIGGKNFKNFPLSAFYFCSAISNIEFDAENPYYTAIDGSCYNKSGTVLIRYTAGKDTTHFDIPDTVTTIGEQSLYDAKHLVSISIPASVKSIGGIAFGECANLTDIYYAGSEDDWAKIIIEQGNQDLKSATVHFNYTPAE